MVKWRGASNSTVAVSRVPEFSSWRAGAVLATGTAVRKYYSWTTDAFSTWVCGQRGEYYSFWVDVAPFLAPVPVPAPVPTGIKMTRNNYTLYSK